MPEMATDEEEEDEGEVELMVPSAPQPESDVNHNTLAAIRGASWGEPMVMDPPEGEKPSCCYGRDSS